MRLMPVSSERKRNIIRDRVTNAWTNFPARSRLIVRTFVRGCVFFEYEPFERQLRTFVTKFQITGKLSHACVWSHEGSVRFDRIVFASAASKDSIAKQPTDGKVSRIVELEIRTQLRGCSRTLGRTLKRSFAKFSSSRTAYDLSHLRNKRTQSSRTRLQHKCIQLSGKSSLPYE